MGRTLKLLSFVSILSLAFMAFMWVRSPSLVVVDVKETYVYDDVNVRLGDMGAPPMMPRPKMASQHSFGAAQPAMMMRTESLGLSVGGSKNAANFRESIDSNVLPLPSDLAVEGLFYEYFFDNDVNGDRPPCTEMFCPTYAFGISVDPIQYASVLEFDEASKLQGNPDIYVGVGLDSNLDASTFDRNDLNVVILLDVSGSMNGMFASKGNSQSKMDVAKESVCALLDQLRDSDTVAIVLFNQHPTVLLNPAQVSSINKEQLKQHIMDKVFANGSTDVFAGLQKSLQMFPKGNVNNENRLIALTDAQPNTGETSESGLLELLRDAAMAFEHPVYTTMIGVGIDFNSDLVQRITRVRGANYFACHTAEELRQQLDEDFAFMVTPVVFDLSLQMQVVDVNGEPLGSQAVQVERVYGIPDETALRSGELMYVNTLFPSRKSEDGVKGGIIIAKLKIHSTEAHNILLTATFTPVKQHQMTIKRWAPLNDALHAFDQVSPKGYFETTGVRKGILLARYAELLRNWMADELEVAKKQAPVPQPELYPDRHRPGMFDRPFLHNKRPMRGPPAIAVADTELTPPAIDHVGADTEFAPPASTNDDLPEFRCRIGRPIPVYPMPTQWERHLVPLHVSSHYANLFSVFLRHMLGELTDLGDETLRREADLLTLLISKVKENRGE